MHVWPLVLGVCLLAGLPDRGAAPAARLRPVAEDLSTWAVPELVQPERPRPSAGPGPRKSLPEPPRKSMTMRLASRSRCPSPSINRWTLS